MIKLTLRVILTLLSLCTLACSNQETILLEDIRNNKEKYNVLVETINKCDFSRFSYNQNIGKKYFPNILTVALNNTKLKDKVQGLLLFKSEDCKKLSFTFL